MRNKVFEIYYNSSFLEELWLYLTTMFVIIKTVVVQFNWYISNQIVLSQQNNF